MLVHDGLLLQYEVQADLNLLEKVHISSISQKQFISNASHELKTPLTSLKLQIEKLKKEGSVEKDIKKGGRKQGVEIN